MEQILQNTSNSRTVCGTDACCSFFFLFNKDDSAVKCVKKHLQDATTLIDILLGQLIVTLLKALQMRHPRYTTYCFDVNLW